MVTRRIPIWLILAVVLVLFAIGGSASARSSTAEPPAPQSPEAASVAVTPLLQYQGRLTNPTTGQPVSDGVYAMTFSLYDAAATQWTETKNVQVAGGLFSTALGDTTPLPQSLFNGQSLWLGIKVGSDLEATPRQAALPVAYALSLVPGASITGNLSSPALRVSNTGGGPALSTSGPTTLGGNVTINGTLSGGTHAHSGADITSGTVAATYIDALIARDSEIMPTVLGNDGAGSTLDADLLDGLQASAFVTASHAHSGADITSGTVAATYIDALIARGSEIMPAVLGNDGAGSTLDADLLDGSQASAFATASHSHSGADITSGTVAATYIDALIARDSEIMPTVLASDGAGSGLDADLLDGLQASAFVTASHTHSGAAITSGTVSATYIDALIARDNEIMPTVLGNDGAGSTLDADLLDGLQASAFVTASHTHSGAAITSGTVSATYIDALIARDSEIMPTVLGNDGAGSTLDADLLDGLQASAFVTASHTHSGAAITSGTVAATYIDALIARDNEIMPTVLGNDGAGSTLDADLLDGLQAGSFAGVTHTHSGTQYFTVGSEGFVPRSNVDYSNSGGNGGAYIISGTGALVAPVHLPQGAVVTEFRVYYFDASAGDLDVILYRQGFSSSYSLLAEVTSSGVVSYSSGIVTTSATIDNTSASYMVNAYSSAWDSNLKIKAAVIKYTVNAVP